ncbi:MFS transporter [Paenibacillus sp. PR3]|uniref:MFS transporter n=1 Tax=Paenibacillus terricola TaxID=2763503 RepID=A0ABR8N182_9BACL|nr:MFS transporter [Paenibacillus terricola]MBD3921935.1 MFS transporter [Paenibacillus terricola]
MKSSADKMQVADPRGAVRLLQTITLLRSIGQGAALTITSLYLRELGWSGTAIGAVIAAASLVRIILTLSSVYFNSRLGAKRALLLFEVITLCAASVMAVTTMPWLLTTAITAAGLGSGHSGTGGPTAPIESAWLGAYAKDPAKSKALFGRNARYSYTGLGAGALLACIPSLLYGTAENAASFRLLYMLIAIVTVGCIICIWRIRGGARKPSSAANNKAAISETLGVHSAATTIAAAAAPEPDERSSAIRTRASLFGLVGLALIIFISVLVGIAYRSNSVELKRIAPAALFVLLIAAANLRLLRKPKTVQLATTRNNQLRMLASSLSGVTAALTSTVTAYWLAERFGASAGIIGLIMGISFLGAALLAQLTSGKAGRDVTLKTIISLQFAAISLLLILPWVTAFWLAALIEIGCTACNLGTRGNRTALMMEERDRHKHTLLSRLNMIAIRLTAVLWPGIFVQFVDEGDYVPPFYLAAAMQFISALLFRRVYRDVEQAQTNAKKRSLDHPLR